MIHVDFERGRRAEGTVVRAPPDGARDRDTVARTFERSEVAELFGISPRRLASWGRHGIVGPSAKQGSRDVYTFADLVAVRTARGLVDAGFPIAKIRKAIEGLRAQSPLLGQPLTEARVGAEGRSLVARQNGARFDPATGQLVLDFDVRALRDDVVRVLRPKVSPRQQEAWTHYLEGLRLDEDETSRPRAERAYRRAIELDPRLAVALTNLGNLRLVSDDPTEAEELYRRAMEADPKLAEAPYNLAYLLVERGDRSEAIGLFSTAIALRPEFAEAHFNLAMALTELGDPVRARPHWERYLALDPKGPWALVARQRLTNA